MPRSAGITENYEECGDRWLSEPMQSALRQALELSESAQCVFASMDYHLDWLYAALLLACNDSTVEEARGDYLLDDTASCPEHTPLRSDHLSLRSVVGNQEDLDMLVVFVDGSRAVIACIEAKGVDSFNKVQLGRKLVRLDRIVFGSGAHARGDLQTRLVLVSPKAPSFESCRMYVLDGDHGLREYLETHRTGIGEGATFVELKGFPKQLRKITRFGSTSAPQSEFTNWRIDSR